MIRNTKWPATVNQPTSKWGRLRGRHAVKTELNWTAHLRQIVLCCVPKVNLNNSFILGTPNLFRSTIAAISLFFSDADLLENLSFSKTAREMFDEIWHVPSNDYWASGHTKFMPEVFPGVRDVVPKMVNWTLFCTLSIFRFFKSINLTTWLLLGNTFRLVSNLCL